MEMPGIIFPMRYARSRAYRWGEDGLLGIFRSRVPALLLARPLEWGAILSSKSGFLVSPIPRAITGRIAKEWYWYLDSTPTHSYMRGGLYKYPQAEFPYARLIEEKGAGSDQKGAGV